MGGNAGIYLNAQVLNQISEDDTAESSFIL